MKKNKNLLENEIRRFNDIIAYQDNLSINEVSYKFYNEADEPGNGEDEFEAPVGAEEIPPAEDPIGDPGVDTNDPAIDNTDPLPTDQVEPTDPSIDPNIQPPAPDQGAEEIPPAEDVTEIDVTDLVNDTKDMKIKLSNIEGGLSKIDAMMNRIGGIEANLGKMDAIIGNLDQLARQVELMRPPTEEERRKALAKDSYPFSVSVDQYNNGEGTATQTDLEKSNKMSMMDTLMQDYNDSAVQDSFNVPQPNPFNKSIQ
jgi:hypothetical protein